MKHRLTAGLLALSLLCTPAAGAVQMLTAAAEETAPTSGTCGENVTWKFEESTGTLTISGTGAMTDYNFGDQFYPDWYSYHLPVSSVIIENGITSIGDEAFFNCSSLTGIIISDGVTSIGEYAFFACTSLTGITIPDSMTYIGGNAFKETPWFTAKREENPLVVVNGILIDGTTCSGDITIPDNVTSIGDIAFSCCYDLTDITIPDSVTSIGYGAFTSCYGLTDITIPNSVTSIGNYGFNDCDGLTEINIPDSVTSIGYGAFSDCTSLTDITFLNPDCEIVSSSDTICNRKDNNYNAIFTGTIHGYTNSTAQSYAEKYGYTFASLDGTPDTPDVPTSGTCGENVTWEFDESTGTLTILGTGAMKDYYDDENDTVPWNNSKSEIKFVIIEDGVMSIGNNAFSYCTSLTGITIPDGVTSIGNNAFSYCTSLTEIIIPDSVTSIGDEAFESCESLTDITIPDSVTSIGDDAFVCCFSLTEITIPDSVTSIGNWAFHLCSSLTEITIPDSVTSIGDSAFSNCTSLTSVTIPDGVMSIGEGAFRNCENLTEITILNSDCEIYETSDTITNGWDEDYNDFFTGTVHGYANSTAQTYAEKYGYTFESLGDAPAVLPGDVSGNGEIDASDAADLLIALANIGAGEASGLTAAQEKAADVNGDGALDAGDAAVILQYTAYLGSGGTGTMEEFLNA